MRRLTDNTSYTVLTRDNLEQIIGEKQLAWAGDFNTQTAAKLGQLMGASLWIVGKVVYCGKTVTKQDPDEPTTEYNVFSTVQIINLETGEVLISSTSDGSYTPQKDVSVELFISRPDKKSNSQTQGDSGTAPEDSKQANSSSKSEASLEANDWSASFSSMTERAVSTGTLVQEVGPAKSPAGEAAKTTEEIGIRLAADDMANSFADKFFGRPLWDHVDMLSRPQHLYSQSLRFVKLGQCQKAVDFMGDVASWELPNLNSWQISEYLHNYGVALLCANHLEQATDKLRAAYRLGGSITTLKMIDLASKLEEWRLEVEPDVQPEIRMLLPPKDTRVGR